MAYLTSLLPAGRERARHLSQVGDAVLAAVPAWRSCLPGDRACLAIVPAWRSCLPGDRACLTIVPA
jgi:hypothetical protein